MAQDQIKRQGRKGELAPTRQVSLWMQSLRFSQFLLITLSVWHQNVFFINCCKLYTLFGQTYFYLSFCEEKKIIWGFEFQSSFILYLVLIFSTSSSYFGCPPPWSSCSIVFGREQRSCQVRVHQGQTSLHHLKSLWVIIVFALDGSSKHKGHFHKAI